MKKEKVITIAVSTAIFAGNNMPVYAQLKAGFLNEKQQILQNNVQQENGSLEQDVLHAKQESEAKKQVMNSAKENKEKADVVLHNVTVDLSKGKLQLEQAKNKAHRSIQTELNKQLSNLEDTKQSVVKIEKEKEALDVQLNQKQMAYNETLTNIPIAQTALQTAKEAARDITPEVLEAAKEKKLAAENQVAIEKGKLEVAIKNVETAKTQAESAEKAMNAASKQLQQAQDANKDAISDLQVANDNLKHAEDILASLQGEGSSEAILIAQENLKLAQQAYRDAKTNAKQAKEQELVALDELNDTKHAYDVVKENISTLQEKLTACNIKVVEAEKKVEHAKTGWSDAKRLFDEARIARDTAKNVANDKGAEVQIAIKNVQTAERNKDAADKKVKAAEASVVEKQTFADNADAMYQKGSLGFFEYLKDDAAVDVLKNAKYKDYTNIGDEKDATGLENMRKALSFIKECNELRKNHNAGALKVSNVMMAMAQSNLNWSTVNMNHSSQFNVAENLAWGYTNPFRGWYDEEKEIYENDPNAPFNQVGHYLNIINPNYQVTGFAVTTKEEYPLSHGQVFSSKNEGESIDSYIEKFETYYSSIINAKTDLELAKKALELAKQEQTTSETSLNDAKQKQQVAEIAKSDADELVKQKESVLSEKQDAVNVAEDKIKEEENLLTVAKQKEAGTQFDIQEAQRILDLLQEEIPKANENYKQKQIVYEKALKSVDDAYTMLKQREDELAAFDISIAEAMQNVQHAKETVEQAEVALSQCQTLYNEAQVIFNSKQENYKKAKQALGLKEQELQDCNALYQATLDQFTAASEAWNRMDALCKAVDDAQVHLQSLEHAKIELELDIKNIKEELPVKAIALLKLKAEEDEVQSYVNNVRSFQQAMVNIEEANIKNLPTDNPTFKEFCDLLTTYQVTNMEVKELEEKYKEATNVAETQHAVFVTAKKHYDVAVQQLTQAEQKWNDFMKEQQVKDPTQSEDKKTENKPVDKETTAIPSTGDTTASYAMLGATLISSGVYIIAKKRKKTK